jgi:hypothetical protein
MESTAVDEFLDKRTSDTGSSLYDENTSAAINTDSSKPDVVSDVIVLKEELINKYSAGLVEFLISQTKRYKDFGMAQSTLKQLIELKKTYWPATQKNANVNITLFDDQLKKWAAVRRSIKADPNTVIMKEVRDTLKEADSNSDSESEEEFETIDANGGK